ncbi:hypothetical protein CC86DRAFT_5133 [Ophiobolus disseminans]|uniref:Uncharacterized protein n=1 Tax=Ophiobolus disseminans TaxID=1469910 RepID=A0A6A7AK70_9PLEO|nr:hypothetical protein CC86DRAFT_5133 [Ophiobolus disseminans]
MIYGGPRPICGGDLCFTSHSSTLPKGTGVWVASVAPATSYLSILHVYFLYRFSLIKLHHCFRRPPPRGGSTNRTAG